MKWFTLSLILAATFTGCCPTNNAGHSSIERPAVQPVMHVVMVHGILEDGKNFNLLRKRLEKHNIACFVPELKPSDARNGLDALALQLKERIDCHLGPDEEFSLLGYSMGGLIGRYYLQNLGGSARCRQLITFSTPHHGSLLAHIYPGRGARQMRRGSAFLAELAKTEELLGDIPVTSYRTPLDLVILPSKSSVWKRADNRTHWAPIHPMILCLPSVMKDVENRLLGHSKNPRWEGVASNRMMD